MRSNETDDEFFGDQEEPEIGGLSLHSSPLDEALTLGGYQSSDGLAQRETFAAEEQFRNIGYHEAYDEAKDARLQEGFEEGYRQCFEKAFKIGELLGQVTSPLNTENIFTIEPDASKGHGGTLSSDEISQQVARHVRSFLDHFEQDEDPTKTPQALLTLTEELHGVIAEKNQ